MRMKKPFNCEAKKIFFVKVKKIEMIAFSDYCTVESYVYIINIFYCPIDHRGLLIFFCFFVFFCETVASIFGHNVFVYLMWLRKDKKNLPRCVLNQMFVLLSCFCVIFLLKMKNQVHEGFLFIWRTFFWTDNHIDV